MAHRSFIRLLALGVCAQLAGALAPQPAWAQDPRVRVPDPLSLEWCLETAQRDNPGIATDRASADAALRRIRPAGSLEDPRLGYAAVNLPVGEWNFDSSPMSGNQFELKQELPFPGLLANREAAARAAAAAAEEVLADRRRRVAADVERTWAALGFAQRALEITESNIELLRQIAKIAEAKYRVGAGLQQDVMRAQVELTLLLEERLGRVAALRTQEARLSALLDLPPATSLPRTGELRDGSPLPDLELLLDPLEEAPRRRPTRCPERISSPRGSRSGCRWTAASGGSGWRSMTLCCAGRRRPSAGRWRSCAIACARPSRTSRERMQRSRYSRRDWCPRPASRWSRAAPATRWTRWIS
jgi:outer membrane protein TolC